MQDIMKGTKYSAGNPQFGFYVQGNNVIIAEKYPYLDRDEQSLLNVFLQGYEEVLSEEEYDTQSLEHRQTEEYNTQLRKIHEINETKERKKRVALGLGIVLGVGLLVIGGAFLYAGIYSAAAGGAVTNPSPFVVGLIISGSLAVIASLVALSVKMVKSHTERKSATHKTMKVPRIIPGLQTLPELGPTLANRMQSIEGR